jgi:hypothetical protein
MNDTTHSTPDTDQGEATAHIILNDGYDGYCVTTEFYTAIRHQVEEVIPALDPDAVYTLEMLCGEVFWDSLTDGKRRKAGRCMTHMVTNNLLPLRSVEGRHEYPKLYQLRQQTI